LLRIKKQEGAAPVTGKALPIFLFQSGSTIFPRFLRQRRKLRGAAPRMCDIGDDILRAALGGWMRDNPDVQKTYTLTS